jgi:hypothetical protein
MRDCHASGAGDILAENQKTETMNAEYYYQLSDGTIDGPAPLDDLLRDFADGMLTDETLVSRGGNDGWVKLGVAKLRVMQGKGKAAPAVAVEKDLPKVEAAEVVPDKAPVVAPLSTGLETMFEAIGYVMALGSVFGMFLAIVGFFGEEAAFVVALSAGGFVSGMMMLAIAKGLMYLRSILLTLRR